MAANMHLVDRMVIMHLARGTDPHPPSLPIDPVYAATYEVVVAELAARRA